MIKLRLTQDSHYEEYCEIIQTYAGQLFMDCKFSKDVILRFFLSLPWILHLKILIWKWRVWYPGNLRNWATTNSNNFTIVNSFPYFVFLSGIWLTSNSFIMGTGLKKCNPPNLSLRFAATAISVMGMEEVLLVKMVCLDEKHAICK